MSSSETLADGIEFEDMGRFLTDGDDYDGDEAKRPKSNNASFSHAATAEEPAPYPIASAALTQDIFGLLEQSRYSAQLRKGANEVLKHIQRGGGELVVLAADCEPLAIISHLPLLCEDRNVPYVYVESKVALGRACGLARMVVAAVVTVDEGSELMGWIREVRERMERLMV